MYGRKRVTLLHSPWKTHCVFFGEWRRTSQRLTYASFPCGHSWRKSGGVYECASPWGRNRERYGRTHLGLAAGHHAQDTRAYRRHCKCGCPAGEDLCMSTHTHTHTHTHTCLPPVMLTIPSQGWTGRCARCCKCGGAAAALQQTAPPGSQTDTCP